MAKLNNILLIEDNNSHYERIERYLAQQNIGVIGVEDGNQALSLIECNPAIDVVLISIEAQQMRGLDFLRVCSLNHPKILVVLLFPEWRETEMLQGLRSGAFDYLCAPVDEDQLDTLLARVCAVLQQRNLRQEAFKFISKVDFELTFKSSDLCVEYMRHAIQDILVAYSRISDNEIQNILLALSEAVQNALDHGNLELESAWKDEPGHKPEETLFDSIKQQRLVDPAFGDKTITISIMLEHDVLQIAVQDQGDGFEVKIADAASGAVHGMGLMMIRNIADCIEFNKKGNKITFQKQLHLSENGA